jgi:hypothetical protein
VSLEESSPSDAPAAKSMSAERLAAQLLDEEDREFLEALQRCGLLNELKSEELLRLASEVESTDEEIRRVDLLHIYYEASGDEAASKRRREQDRFLVQRVGDPATAASLVARLAQLAPELGAVRLERIGGGDGPLVLRAGEHFSAVLDDYEEESDTDELDLKAVQQRERKGPPMVTVRGLVRALNVLLDRHGVRDRLIALRGDEHREVYVGLGVSEAIQLGQAGMLDDEDTEDVMELGAW